MADGSIDVCLFNGGIRNSEQEYMARLLRKKSKVLVAFGSCAQEGGIPALANLNNGKRFSTRPTSRASRTENPRACVRKPETPHARGPHPFHLPVFYDTLKTLARRCRWTTPCPAVRPRPKTSGRP